MRLVALLAVISTAAWSGPLSSQGPHFSPASDSLVVGLGSGQVVFADLNRDSHADVLTRHLLTQTITISMGSGSARFGPAQRMTFGYPPADMKVGDVDGDGVLDLAVTGNTGDFVDVFRGDGRGAFSRLSRSPFTVENTTDALNKRTLHLVDLNEDGHLDIATANGRRRNTLGVLLGDGRGTFTRGPIVALESGRDRYWYALGDLDGDGHADVVTASSASDEAGAASRLLAQCGDGRGRFTPMADHPIPLPATAGPMTLGDFDRDGRIDVAVAHPEGTISLLLNRGRGVFIAAPGSPIRIGRRAHAIALRDMNGDSQPDLLAATVDSVTVLFATPSGYREAPGSPFPAGPGAYNITVHDVNRDGKPDIAASSFEGATITLLLGR